MELKYKNEVLYSVNRYFPFTKRQRRGKFCPRGCDNQRYQDRFFSLIPAVYFLVNKNEFIAQHVSRALDRRYPRLDQHVRVAIELTWVSGVI